MIRRLFNFHGGLVLDQHKKESTNIPVEQAAIPEKLILPLQQHIGEAAEAIVKKGEQVYKGQIIARPTTSVSCAVHTPTSGKVIDIGEYPIPHPSGLKSQCIVIKTDGLDQSRRSEKRFYNYKEMTPEAVREVIRMSGIVGLGGAGFPSAIKLNPRGHVVETLILNGVECEPYITCDDMLMQEQANEIIEGLLIMRHALKAKHCIIAIENNKPDAYEAMEIALYNAGFKNGIEEDIELVKIPTVYPSGGEKQLIQLLTGKEIPHLSIPLDIGIVTHNVGTTYAVSRALEHGEPLISRYMTLTGSVAKQRVLNVMIGTPICDLISQYGGNPQTLNRIIMGGPMMGYSLHDIRSPVIKTTNCIMAQSVIADVPLASRDKQALPCIRCGACAEACPVNLLPQQLYWHARAKEFDKVQDYHLFDCIECGCCDYVCPSQIPLVQYYRYAKTEIWNQEREKHLADISRERHEYHQLRIEREKAERAARHKKKRAAVSGDANAAKKQAAIQAAMDRVKSKRIEDGAAPKNTDNLTAEQQQLIADVDTRRANKNKRGPKNDAS